MNVLRYIAIAILCIVSASAQSTRPLLIQSSGTSIGQAEPIFWSNAANQSAIASALSGTFVLTNRGVLTSGTLSNPTVTGSGTFTGTTVFTGSSTMILMAGGTDVINRISSAYNSSMYIGFDASSQQKLHLGAPRVDNLFGTNLGTGFCQNGQAAFDNAYWFLNCEGAGSADRINVPSKRMYLANIFFDGVNQQVRFVGFRSDSDSAGNNFLGIAITGTAPQPAFPFSWPPATIGNYTVRMFDNFTEVPTIRITGTTGQAGTSVPTIHHVTGTTTGIEVTATTATLQVSGTTLLSANSGAIHIPNAATAGSGGLRSLSNPTTGWRFNGNSLRGDIGGTEAVAIGAGGGTLFNINGLTLNLVGNGMILSTVGQAISLGSAAMSYSSTTQAALTFSNTTRFAWTGSGVNIGPNGSNISQIVSGTGTLSIPTLAALTAVNVDIPVAGATSTGTPNIPVTPGAALPDGLVYQSSYVVASGTVRATYFNANPVSAVSGTFTVRATVIQP